MGGSASIAMKFATLSVGNSIIARRSDLEIESLGLGKTGFYFTKLLKFGRNYWKAERTDFFGWCQYNSNFSLSYEGSCHLHEEQHILPEGEKWTWHLTERRTYMAVYRGPLSSWLGGIAPANKKGNIEGEFQFAQWTIDGDNNFHPGTFDLKTGHFTEKLIQNNATEA